MKKKGDTTRYTVLLLCPALLLAVDAACSFEVELAGAGFERPSFLAQFELGLLRLPAPAPLLGELPSRACFSSVKSARALSSDWPARSLRRASFSWRNCSPNASLSRPRWREQDLPDPALTVFS